MPVHRINHGAHGVREWVSDMGKYDFVMGLEGSRGTGNPRSREEEAADKMRQEAEMRAASADMPPEAPPAPGGGDWSGVESIGRAAQDIGRRAESRAPRDGLQGIQDTALDILARAQARGRR